MQKNFCLVIVIGTMFVTAGVSLSSDLQPGRQNSPVASPKKIQPDKQKKRKSRKIGKNNLSKLKNNIPAKENTAFQKGVRQNDTVPKKAKGPVIKLESPPDGLEVVGYDGIMLKGTVDDPNIEKVTLLLNDVPVPIRVQDGRFSRKIFLPGRISTFRMMAKNKTGAVGYSALHTVSYFKRTGTKPDNTVGVVPDISHLMQKTNPK